MPQWEVEIAVTVEADSQQEAWAKVTNAACLGLKGVAIVEVGEPVETADDEA